MPTRPRLRPQATLRPSRPPLRPCGTEELGLSAPPQPPFPPSTTVLPLLTFRACTGYRLPRAKRALCAPNELTSDLCHRSSTCVSRVVSYIGYPQLNSQGGESPALTLPFYFYKVSSAESEPIGADAPCTNHDPRCTEGRVARGAWRVARGAWRARAGPRYFTHGARCSFMRWHMETWCALCRGSS